VRFWSFALLAFARHGNPRCSFQQLLGAAATYTRLLFRRWLNHRRESRLADKGTLLSQSDWKHMRKKIDAAEAEAKLVKAKRILRAEKKKAKKLKGGKLERANVELAIKTMEVGVEAVEKLRDAAEELEVKNPAPE
jgi:tRNA U34 5-carboxymethylaminomethyl modifying enzyme MnmG/GidA